MSIAVCLMMITSISAPITQNVGQFQNLVQSGPSPTSGGSGGLADSPWPMHRHDIRHTGLSPYDTSTNLGNLKWSFVSGDNVESSPVISSDGTIYVGSWDGKLYAINPDGTEKWSFTSGEDISSSAAIGSDGTIYVGSCDGKLYAINPDSSEKWNFTIGSSDHSSPAIGSDGTIYIGPGTIPKIPGVWQFYAINQDGTQKWSFDVEGPIYSSPAIGTDGTVYVGSNDYKLYAINPDGTEKWNFTTGGCVYSSPAIGSNGTIYVGSNDYKLYAINPDGTEKWNFMTFLSVMGSSPAIGSDGTIYIGSWDDKLYAINPDGTKKWHFTTGDNIWSSPAIGSEGTIYVGSHDGKLYAINPDGTEKWSFVTGHFVRSSPAIGPDGTIYVGSYDDKFYAIGNPSLDIDVTSHFSELNSAAQSAITVHVTDGTNPAQGATVNLDSDNGGIFSPQSGITDANGDFKSIFNAPTVTSQIISRISAEVSKTDYNDGSGYVDVTINPIPWPMFRQNLNHTGVSPYDTSWNPGKLKWSFMTGGYIHSSPSVGSDETIYIGSGDNKVYAINPDGTEKWNFTTGNIVQSSPTIGSDGTIYVGSFDDKLYAINPDGSQKWNFTTGGDIQKTSATIASDGTVYIGSQDNKLYAINPDGSQKWNFITGGSIWSSPTIGPDGTIYIGSFDDKVYAINPNGTEKWSFMSRPGLYVNVYVTPAIGSNGIIYIGSGDSYVYAIYPNGSKKWDFFTEEPTTSSPAIDSDGTIYIGSYDGNLYAINPDGTEKWKFQTGEDVWSSPAIGSDGTIYFGSEDSKIYAINPNGTEKWNFTTGYYVHSSPAIGSDGTIYVGSGDFKLYAIGKGGTPPIANAGSNQLINEGESIHFNASSSYDSDGTIESYEWDFDVSNGLWWETGAPPDATGPTPTHTYGDDGIYIVTLRVTNNDNLSATDTCNVTVQNVDPTVTTESVLMNVEIGLRVAGRKYNNVNMALYEDGNQLGYISIERMPGSPDEQMAWIPVSINFSKSYSATVTYTPEDPPNVGGNPVWIYIKSQNGSIKKIHHTFNVQQSKKKDSDHWNHVEPWEVGLNGHFIGLPFEITSHITDPGSDDENLTFAYGSQVVTVVYLNNPPNSDQYPSPEVNPVDLLDKTELIYEGPGTITLTVYDDDDGIAKTNFAI